MDKVTALLIEGIEDMYSPERIAESYVGLYGKSPEEIVCQRETYRDLINIYCAFTSRLYPRQKETLYKYVIEKKSIAQIARDYGINDNKPLKHLEKIRKNFKKFMEDVKRYIPEIQFVTKEDLFVDIIKDGSSKSKFSGPVSEAYMNRGILGYWGIKNGKKAYKTKVECKIHEYLDLCLHKISICTLCEKCTNKEMKARRIKYKILKGKPSISKRKHKEIKPVVVKRYSLWGQELPRVKVKGETVSS